MLEKLKESPYTAARLYREIKEMSFDGGKTIVKDFVREKPTKVGNIKSALTVSTRRVEKVMTALGVERISASSVSRITKELDEKVGEFLSKPIEHEIPYLFVDATYLKVRDGLHYGNKALFVVAGIRDDGLREILGVRLA